MPNYIPAPIMGLMVFVAEPILSHIIPPQQRRTGYQNGIVPSLVTPQEERASAFLLAFVLLVLADDMPVGTPRTFLYQPAECLVIRVVVAIFVVRRYEQ